MSELSSVVVGTAGAAVAASAAVLARAVRVPSCTLLAPSVHRGASTRRAIALTFDDGPSESTPELLEILARYRAPATFFQCGANIRRLPEIARAGCRAPATKSAIIPIRTPNCTSNHAGFIYRELAAAQETIEAATGVRPRYFRAPFGARWFGLREAQRRLGLMGVMWTTIGVDWKLPAPEVTARMLAGAANGAIFCLHDGRTIRPRPDISATLQAVRELLPKLMESGFHFEKVTDILCPTTN